MRRIVWLLFVLSLIEGVRIYINAQSNGLAKYTPTFSTYLITTTLGRFFITFKVTTMEKEYFPNTTIISWP